MIQAMGSQYNSQGLVPLTQKLIRTFFSRKQDHQEFIKKI